MHSWVSSNRIRAVVWRGGERPAAPLQQELVALRGSDGRKLGQRALGIGGNSVVLGFMNGLITRPMALPDAPGTAVTVLAQRAETLDKIVIDNLDLVLKFSNARQAGDRREQVLLLSQLVTKL